MMRKNDIAAGGQAKKGHGRVNATIAMGQKKSQVRFAIRSCDELQFFLTVGLLFFRFFHKIKGGGVDAISPARWRRSVVKHMPQMRGATAAGYFSALHVKAAVGAGADIFGNRRRKETRPARARVEFRL
jgi:hypothetical protein